MVLLDHVTKFKIVETNLIVLQHVPTGHLTAQVIPQIHFDELLFSVQKASVSKKFHGMKRLVFSWRQKLFVVCLHVVALHNFK